MIKSTLKNIFSVLSRRTFRIAESLGVHITPVHFYSPIPHVDSIDPSFYGKINNCAGLDFQEGLQSSFIEDVALKYVDEFTPIENTGLSKVDAYILYSMIRHKSPKLFVEIGSGESTKISLKALQANHAEGTDFEYIAIEPYPKEYLRDIDLKNFSLMVKKVQDIPLSVFQNADILFIDSSHVSKFGSDVNYEMLEIVPSMKVGSIIHWHDIMIPGDYPRNWVEEKLIFWNESYIVHAFMMFNKTFKIIWASRYMQTKHSDLLSQKFSFFAPGDPDQQLSSFWIERVA